MEKQTPKIAMAGTKRDHQVSPTKLYTMQQELLRDLKSRRGEYIERVYESLVSHISKAKDTALINLHKKLVENKK